MYLPPNIHDAILRYHAEYRNSRLPVPSISDPYSLFPDSTYAGRSKWPDSWEHAGRPGVYLIFGSHGELLYVGKDAELGRRLGTYFQYAPDRTCRVVDESSWQSHTPKFVFTVALERAFEAPSLEEFLIVETKPLLNRTWSSAAKAQPNTALERTRER